MFIRIGLEKVNGHRHGYMKKILFQDMNDKKIQVSTSGCGNFRIYYDVDNECSPCLLLNEHQANILIESLKDLINYK